MLSLRRNAPFFIFVQQAVRFAVGGDYMERIQKGLYDSAFEHDACGIGAVISIDGAKSHKVVDDALKIVEKLEHRAGKDATGETGDGVGILLQISHKFFSRVAKENGIDIGKEREYAVGMFFFPTQTLARNQAKKLFDDFQCIVHNLMAFRSVNADHGADTARIVLKGTVIKTFLYSFHIVTSDSKRNVCCT